MPGNPVGIRCGTSSFLNPLDVLGLAADGFRTRRLLQDGISGVQGGDTGLPSVPHHLQCGGGCGSPSIV